ncbi:Uncharacterised protein [Clostridium tertium]|uniref:Lipoprotein n=1 Tax=Clostridium tertium TaxID=1559 RepID=A0A6N3FW90_9CLOT
MNKLSKLRENNLKDLFKGVIALKNKIMYVLSLIILNLYILSSCSYYQASDVEIDLFKPKIAYELSEKYLGMIRNDNIEGAKSLCTENLLSKNNEITTGTSKIISYEPEALIEATSKSAFITFNVIRNSSSEPKCDLDNFAIKVIKDGEDYKIDEIKAMNKMQVFVKNDSLRIIGEDGGKSDLIVSLNNMPKDVYLRRNKLMLYKEKVEAEAFGPVALGYKGKKIAISTTGGNKSFLSIAFIEESKATQGESTEAKGEEGKTETNLEDILDKPIAKKVVPLDLLDNVKIDNLVFTKEEGFLIVEYVNSNSIKRIKVYNSEDGELVDINFDKEFPEDTYNISLVNFDKDEFKILVSGKLGSKNIKADILGEYTVFIEGKEIKKSI